MEASPYDRIWGIGLKASDKGANDPERWPGLELLGFALMSVRENLRSSPSVRAQGRVNLDQPSEDPLDYILLAIEERIRPLGVKIAEGGFIERRDVHPAAT